MQRLKKILKWLWIIFIVIAGILFLLSLSPKAKNITYGTSFSKLHAEELGLDWKKVFIATLDDLKIREYRLSAHWNNTEPKRDSFNFADLDFQMNESKKRGAKVILSIGRRLPGWPECHPPEWANTLPKEEKQKELLAYIEAVVNRYKDYPNLLYWQVENEAFLRFYAKYHCQDFLSTEFFEEEIALVKKLDPDTLIFLTDSGELSLWYQAYTRADVFGTSVYIYIWNHYVGAIRYPITPGFFRIKHNIMKILFKNKPAVLSELSLEPWLLKPIVETPINEQLERMDINKFNNIIKFASKTDFESQYLWGVEWWYYMNQKDHPEFWNRAKELYAN